MAALAPVATTALGLFKTAATVSSVLGATQKIFNNRDDRQSDQALRQLQAQQQLQESQAASRAALERDQIAVSAEQAESERRRALKRAVARQRVNFGASGIGSDGGSSEAVLLGLFDESEEERKTRERLDSIRLQSLDQQLGSLAQRNTLERTQKAERDRLKVQTNSLETLSDLFR